MLTFLLAAMLVGEWQPLGDWTETPFTGRGKVRMEQGSIVLENGAPMTGVTRTKPFPKGNYEIRWQAMRRLGGDFFASLTFPLGDSFATFVTGGWGGDIVGVSSIDGWDASENETRTYFNFENGKWYGMRLEVRGDRIRAWIDDKVVVNVVIGGRRIDLRRGEMNLSAPLGFASYRTVGEVKGVEFRELGPR